MKLNSSTSFYGKTKWTYGGIVDVCAEVYTELATGEVVMVDSESSRGLQLLFSK